MSHERRQTNDNCLTPTNADDSPTAVQVASRALGEIRDSVRRALADNNTSNELPENVTLTRDYSFHIGDFSLAVPRTTRSATEQPTVRFLQERNRIYSDGSYFRSNMERTPENIGNIIPTDVENEILRLRNSQERNHDDAPRPRRSLFDPQPQENISFGEILNEIREMRIQMANLARPEQPDEFRPSRSYHENPLNLTYGRTARDVRNQPGSTVGFLTLKEARSMIPEINGTSRDRVQEFLNASAYAMKNIHPADEHTLLEAIICTKFKGRAMKDFHTRDIVDYEQLRREVESEYLGKRSITHLQLEFNTLKQKHTENAQDFGRRVETLAMDLYEAMEEGQGHTIDQQRAILDSIKLQALHNYQIGLHDEIKLLVRAQKYKNLQEAISGASAEEKVKGPKQHTYPKRTFEPHDNRRINSSLIQCRNCGRNGHLSRECKSSRYPSRYTLPERRPRVNAIDKYCNYCKKTGHTRNECWILNGKPDGGSTTRNMKGRQNYHKGNNETRFKTKKQVPAKSSDEEEQEEASGRKTRTAADYRVSHIRHTRIIDTGLDLISLTVREAEKKHIKFLFDTGATISLVKLKTLKGNTKIRENIIKLIGVTGHSFQTIGETRISIPIGTGLIKHTVYVVPDDTALDYDGILGADFIRKNKVTCYYGSKKIRIGQEIFPLFPFKKTVINPRSETIVSAITNKNQLGIVAADEIQPGIFIGNCLVDPTEHTCRISILNTTTEPITLTTPYLEIEEIQEKEIQIINTLHKKQDNKYKTDINRKKSILENLQTEHLNKEETLALQDICEEFSNVFHLEGDPLTYSTAVTHEIRVKPDSAPVNVRPYRLPETHKQEINRQIKKMLKEEIIRPSISQWNAPILVVPKKPDNKGKSKLRLVIDFRKLNELTIGDSFPIPNITDILDQLGSAKYFSTLDLASGYHQIAMREEDKEKTAFSTQYGHFEFNRMPFGLKNAPATFQRAMNAVLVGIQGVKCLVYLDDIVVYGSSLQEHNKRLVEVLQRLKENNLRLQTDKCIFLCKEVTYLGHLITQDGIKPDPSKLSAVEEFPTPGKIKDVQSFLGLAGYYRKFINNFSKIAKPLTVLTHKGRNFLWTSEQQEAFDTLKIKLTTAPVLSYPDLTREFNVTTDASDYAIGAVLSQGQVGQDRPIAYASRILNKAERNYNTTEKELLAIVWAVKHFRPYLYGTKFKIITDHKPLIWLFSIKDPGSRLIRWRLKLEEYHYEIIHRAGKINMNADALSRISGTEPEHIHNVDVMQEYTEEDKKQILYEYHNAPCGGHQGIARTLNRIRQRHNWSGITRDVEEYIAKCEECQRNKTKKKTKMPLIITDTSMRPFQKCALDIVGPLNISAAGNKYLLTFQDDLTKYSKAIPLPNQEAKTVAKEFVTKIICEYGIPETVLTDQGTNFLSEMFKNTCKLLKIHKIQTTAYHPESNGALERSHRTLTEYLRHYINQDLTDWDEWIPYAMFTYNTTPHTATTFSPFELIYGHQAIIPTALSMPPKQSYSYDDYVQELRERLRATQQIARTHIADAKNKAKQQADKNTNAQTFQIGDKVLLLDESLRRGRSKKLEAPWIGPYRITEKISDVNYKIAIKRKNICVHANRLKLFVEA